MSNFLQWPLFPEYTPLVNAEQNLEEFPLFELKARKRGTKARVFEKTVSGEDGVSLTQVWKVMPSGEYGMPGPVDQDVYLAVLQLLQQRGGMPESGELRFSLYELRKILGRSDDSAGLYKEIRESLVRIATTSVQSQNAFYSAEEQRRIVDTFNIWSVHFAEHEVGGRTVRERHVLKFHPVFIHNYIAQYLKGIDSDFYWALDSPISKRLYRLVDLERAGGPSWKTDLFAVRDQVPLSYHYPSQIRRALQKAHNELVEREFLSAVEYEGTTGVLYKVSHEFARRQKARELSGDPKEIFTIERLIREGIDGGAAREMVVTHGPNKCLFYADAVNHQRGVGSRAGWIIAAIKEGWTVRHTGSLQEALPGSTEGCSSLGTQKEKRTVPPAPPRPNPAAAEVWDALLEELSLRINAPSLRVWFEGTVPTAFEGSTLVLRVPNNFALQYIETRFGELMRMVLKEQVGPEADLSVQAPGGTGSAD